MGKWLHRLQEVDAEKHTAICAVCGPVRIRHGGHVVWRCIKTASRRPGRGGKASRQKYTSKRRSSKERCLAFKQSTCERYGFEVAHPSQIDVHHIDGNRENDTPDNWQSLCANCHRLPTYAPHHY